MAALLLLQWNAQGMFGHGHELIKFLEESKDNFHVICVQETWFYAEQTFPIPNFTCLSRTRNTQQRGGCAIYVHESINYDSYLADGEQELQRILIHYGNYRITLINFYNPCKKLNENDLQKLYSYVITNDYIIKGDLNGHNTLWGSEKTDHNGKIIETIIDKNDSVLLNDGSGTRIDTHSGKISHLDLTITSPSLAGKCTWSIEKNQLGSDHFLIGVKTNLENNKNITPTNENQEEFWSFKKFDWNKFKELCEVEFCNFDTNQDPHRFFDNFMKTITKVIKETLPRKRSSKYNPIPWWTRECSTKIKERNKARNKLARTISIENLRAYQKKKAEAQKTLRRAKQGFWDVFCSKLDRYTQESKLWTCIRRMNQLPTKVKNVPLLKVNNDILTTDTEKANAFAENLFSLHDMTGKRNNPTPTDTNHPPQEVREQAINEPFQIKELEKGLIINKQSAPGLDKIPYEIYSNLPSEAKEILLQLFNKIWNNIALPNSCKHTILVPILKPNKDPHDTKSYRPIALLPCFIKIMEKMIKDRLNWFTEKHKILPPFISGFRQGRSAIDNVVHLENTIQKNINNKNHSLAVFVDIAHAYDDVDIEGLMFKLASRGLHGRMLSFLHLYLTNRTYQVRINNQLSQIKTINKGLPQGSILSPLLFNIMMSDIPTNAYVEILTYADDIVIFTSGKNTKILGKKIQEYLDTLNIWFEKWGFTLSWSKTIPVLFTKSTKPYLPTLKLKDKTLTYATSHKFLGMIFDSKLLWHPHVENIVARCKRKLNFLKCLSGTKWGSTTKSLLTVYRSYIRSLLDYGCEAYDSAAESVKKSLDSVQYQALRICTGTLPLTPLNALQAETGEMPLKLRRQMLSEKFKLSVNRIPNHPILPHINHCWQFEYLKSKNCNKPFGYRTINTNISDVEHLLPNTLPPWIMTPPNISIELKNRITKLDSPHLMLQYTKELIRRKWFSELHIYTDGSMIPQTNVAAAAFWVPTFNIKQYKRLTYAASSMKAELAAIILALTWIDQLVDLHTGVVIFTDSLSGLMAIQNLKNDNFVDEIWTQITHLSYKNIHVSFEWIPAHCGLQHNETVDYYAKMALSCRIEIVNKKTFHTEKMKIIQKINKIWQEEWQESNSPLRQIQPTVPPNYQLALTRQEETIIHRLRVGIIGLNEELFKLGRHESGHCNNCQEMETMEHFLTSCPHYIIPRSMLLTETDLMETDSFMTTLLKSKSPYIQRALIRFIHRTNRLN